MEDKGRKRTREAGEAWRRFEAQVQQLVGDLAKEELPANWWHEVWRFMERRRRRARKYIRSEYGIEVQRPEWLERLLVRERRRGASQKQIVALILAFAPNPVVDPHRAFERFGSERHRDRLRAGCWSYTLYDGVRRHIQEACSAVLAAEGIEELELPLPPLPPKTTQALNQAVLDILTDIPYGAAALAGDVARLSPVPKEAEAAAFALAGFVDAHISRSRSYRHNKALEHGGQLDSLPASAAQAWEERPPDEPIYRHPRKQGKNLISRVEGKLSGLGDESAEKPEQVAGHLDPQLDIPPPEQFSAREAAARQQLNALKEKAKLAGAGLTEREDWVLELHKIQGYTHAEIATLLKLSEGTSQAALKMGMKKLRRAASYAS